MAERFNSQGHIIQACLVCLSSFFILFMADFIVTTYGLLMMGLRDAFETETSKLSMVGSVFLGCNMLIGPIVSILLDRWSCRCVIIGGTLVAVAGFVLSSFSTNVEMLIFTYGCIAGSAVGVVYITGIVMVGLRFTRRRGLATGIAMSGSGAGVLTMSYPLERLLVEYGWRGTVIIIAGLFLHCCVFGALVFPPRRALKTSSRQQTSFANEPSLNVTNKHRPLGGLSDKSLSSDNLMLQQNGPTEGLNKKSTTSKEFIKQTVSSVGLIQPLEATEEGIMDNELSEGLIKKSDPSAGLTKQGKLPDSIYSRTGYADNNSEIKCLMLRDKKQYCHWPDIEMSTEGNILPKAPPLSYMNPLLNRSLPMVHQRQTPQDALEMSRDLESVKSITNYSWSAHLWCSEPSLFLRSSRSHPIIEIEITEQKHLADPGDSSLKSWLKRHLDLGKNPSFLMILIIMSLFTGFLTIMMYLPDLAVSRGLTRAEASFLISGFGVANIVGRVLSGALSNIPRVDSSFVYAGALFLMSGDVVFLLYCNTFAQFMAGSVLFGLCSATCMCLRTIVVVDVLGVETLTVAFGIICVAQGICYIILPPICGILFASSGSFHLAFYLISVMNGIGGVVCSLLRPVQKWRTAREAKKLEKPE